MASKKTKRDFFAEVRAILEGANRADLVDFIDHEIELVSRKASSKSETPRQQENKRLIEVIADVLRAYPDGATVTAILKEPEVANFESASVITSQRVTAVLNLATDRFKRDASGKVPLYSLV